MATTTTEHPSQEERQAARQYLEHDYSAMHLGGAAGRQANRHAEEIDENHPRARDIALAGTARELGQLPRHLKEHQMKSRQRAGIRQAEALALRKAFRSGPHRPAGEPATGATGRQRALTGARAAGTVGARAAQRGYRSATRSGWGELVLDSFLAAVVLSLGYLLINRAAAASKLSEGAARSVRAIVSPTVDPLNPKGVI